MALLRIVQSRGIAIAVLTEDLVKRGHRLGNSESIFDARDKLEPANVRLRNPGLVELCRFRLAVMLRIVDRRLRGDRQPEIWRSSSPCPEETWRSNSDHFEWHSVHDDLAANYAGVAPEAVFPTSIADRSHRIATGHLLVIGIKCAA